MRKGWYILNYHDVSWFQTVGSLGVQNTVPPDIFDEHLKTISNYFRLVSVMDGYKLFAESKIDEPLLSLWFDDGFRGVREFAEPIMNKYNLVGSIAINFDFVNQKRCNWRFMLSNIHYAGRTQEFLNNLIKKKNSPKQY